MTIRAAWNWSHAKLLCALPNTTSSLVGGGSFKNAQLLRVHLYIYIYIYIQYNANVHT